MERMQIVIMLSSLLLLSAEPAFAQSEDPEYRDSDGSSEDIVTIEEPAYEYYYWPDEDLDSFGLSSMGSGKSGTTLGTATERTSNLEVNAPRKPNTDEANPPAGGFNQEEAANLYEDETSINPPSNTPSENPIYKWVDDEGNLHITNNLGDVPQEYREELYNKAVLDAEGRGN